MPESQTGPHWCFLDASPLDYHVGTPASRPLGGSQSALCFLARELAVAGPQVTLLNANTTPGVYAGVQCQRLPALKDLGQTLPAHFPAQYYVSLNEYRLLAVLPPSSNYLKIFWNQHNDLVPGMDGLQHALERRELDAIVFVSDWQRQRFISRFELPPERCLVRRNAMGEAFARRFDSEPSATQLQQRHANTLKLAYTSNPGRGLGVLLAIFPALRQLFPGLELDVFSSLAGYQGSEAEEAPFQALYQECHNLEGVHYHGNIPQPELAAALSEVQILAYPNRYPETSCIAAIEALAAGCRIVSSALGALPETCGGFAHLIPYEFDHRPYTFAYLRALRTELEQWQHHPELWYQQLAEAAQWAHRQYRWSERAQAWLQIRTAIRL